MKNWSVNSSMRGKQPINLQILYNQTLPVTKYMKETNHLKAIWHSYSFIPELSKYEKRKKSMEDFLYCTSKHIFVDITKFQEI